MLWSGLPPAFRASGSSSEEKDADKEVKAKAKAKSKAACKRKPAGKKRKHDDDSDEDEEDEKEAVPLAKGRTKDDEDEDGASDACPLKRPSTKGKGLPTSSMCMQTFESQSSAICSVFDMVRCAKEAQKKPATAAKSASKRKKTKDINNDALDFAATEAEISLGQ